MWRAVTDTPLQNAGYVAIIVWEALAGVILFTAFVLWIRERGTTFTRARALSSIGLLMIVVLFVGGFIDIGGEWFQMWRSTAWNGLDTAFRTIVLAALPLILIHLPSPIWARGSKSR
jgi:predicted small integral membrane protein